MVKGYKKLLAWEKSDQLALLIYRHTKGFPSEERFGIVSQLRRSALSVPTNIAEGSGRQNKRESKHFFNIALGSLTEVEYLLEFSEKLGYLKKDIYEELEALRNHAGRLLWGLINKQ